MPMVMPGGLWLQSMPPPWTSWHLCGSLLIQSSPDLPGPRGPLQSFPVPVRAFWPACSPRRTSCEQARRGKGPGPAPERIMVICQADPSFKELLGWTDCVCADCRLCLVPLFGWTLKRSNHLRTFRLFTQKDGSLILLQFVLFWLQKKSIYLSVCLSASQSTKQNFHLEIASKFTKKKHATH